MSVKLKWALFVGLALVIALVCLVLGFGLSEGWDFILGWFTGKYAFIVYTFAGFYLLLVGYFIIEGYVKK